MLPLDRLLLATVLLQLALCLPASAQVQLSLSDSASSIVDFSNSNHEQSATTESDATEVSQHEGEAVYSNRVSHDPGWPRKPVWDRPGDINQAKSPAPRYCQDDCFRAGWPHSVRSHAQCSINSHYSAWFVGGGSAFGLPHSRPRTKEEGTWGLDYSLFKKPQLVWMRWTCGREQGGEGAYATDH